MIYIASDHAGFELKNQLLDHLRSKGLEVEDCGASSYDKDDDYPNLVYPCAVKVAAPSPRPLPRGERGEGENRGIVIGYSGQGEAIVANKVKGIRTTVYYGGNLEIIKLGRQHNNANVLSLGAGFLSLDEAKQAVDLWLSTEFEGGRHQRRMEKILKLETL